MVSPFPKGRLESRCVWNKGLMTGACNAVTLLHLASIVLCSCSCLMCGVPWQERLTAGYRSLAERIRATLHMNVTIAPAGLAWQQVHRMSLGSAAEELPQGKFLWLSHSPLHTCQRTHVLRALLCMSGGLSEHHAGAASKRSNVA